MGESDYRYTIRKSFIWLSLCVAGSVCSGQHIIPASSRSRQAILRVKPILEQKLAEKDLQYGAPLFIRIFKDEMELEVWLKNDTGFTLFNTYPICTFGSGDLGPKIKQDDGKAPEGFYFVTPSGLNPASDFHLSFNLGYPNRYDTFHRRTGNALMVHGRCVSVGCYAMTDSGIEEIYALADAALRKGQPFFRVHIFPFRMTDANLKKYEHNEWFEFWSNLKEGYDFFEQNKTGPPNVEVRDGRYIFEIR